MPPAWLQTLASYYVPLSIAGALLVTIDIFALKRRQHMAIMEAVWPLTMLYWGPLGLPFYAWFGRAPAHMGHSPGAKHGDTPMWQATFKGATHCGAGCALGDFTGDWIAFATAFTLFGSAFGGSLALSFALAYLLGVVFQYLSIVPMRHLGFAEGVLQAIKIDTLSLLAYEIGMFVVMGGREWLYPDLRPTNWTYWLLTQVAMVAGFLTTYPVILVADPRRHQGENVTQARRWQRCCLRAPPPAALGRPASRRTRCSAMGRRGAETYGLIAGGIVAQAALPMT